MVLRPKASKLDATFMVYNFYSANIRNRIFATASGLTTPHLNVSDVRGLLVPLPIIAEQFEIASYVKAVDARLTVLANKRCTLSGLFRTLLHQLMTAQIRVYDLDVREFREIK
jgi:type I restriction enzyme S subunit